MAIGEGRTYSDGYRDGYRDGFNDRPQKVRSNDVYPSPAPAWDPKMTCSKCGMIWSGAMLYCCPKPDCPVQPKPMC